MTDENKKIDRLLAVDEAVDGVFHQGADRHRPYSSGNWGDDGGLVLHFIEIHISAEFAVDMVYSDIYHHGTFLHHVGFDELR